MKNSIPFNIPNLLSLYRLIVFPFVLYFALAGQERVFVVLLCINLITDILDGFIARRFNMMTEIGAKLDSIADVGTYILAFLGVWLFKKADFEPHSLSFFTFFGLFLGANILALLRFGRFSSLHLYSYVNLLSNSSRTWYRFGRCYYHAERLSKFVRN